MEAEALGRRWMGNYSLSARMGRPDGPIISMIAKGQQ